MVQEFEKPDATLQILLRDGSVIERGLLQPEVRIGKGAQNDIILPDASVSSTHAKIAHTAEKFIISDLGSRNGTYLNDVRIVEPRDLQHGDRIRMGHCLLTFRIEDSTPAAPINLERIDLNSAEVDAGAAALLRPEYLREKLVCPIAGAPAGGLLLALADPTDQTTIAEIEELTRKKVSPRMATASEIKEKLEHYFTPRLIGVTSDGRKVEALLKQVETDIGKSPHNRFVISDPTVSNTHAVIIARDGCYSIVDLGSSNGTTVDGKQLGSEAYNLKHGDKIQLGQVVLTFRNPAETSESRTARLMPESLSELGNRIAGNAPRAIGSGLEHVPVAFGQAITSNSDNSENSDEKKEKKKKKKEGERIMAALVNSTSRILATILGTVLSLLVALYFVKQGSQPSSGSITKNQRSSEGGLTTLSGTAWKDFNTGFLRSPIEASGVAYLPGSNGVVLVSDNREGEVLWMPLDGEGRQAGSLKSIPLGVKLKDPEAITYGYGSSYFYLIGSQSDPKNGGQNALVRFELTPQTQSLRGKAEVINDFRSFLLSRVPEIEALGRAPGAEGGLNIEGIAWDPNQERLLLGLRSPLFGEQAVLIPLKLRDLHGPFNSNNLSIDEPHVIDFPLGGQGIRDLTYDAHTRNFLIISGAAENQPKAEFGLWEWSGRPGVNPVKLMNLDERRKPEGLTDATINGRNFIFVVADAGGYLKLNYQ